MARRVALPISAWSCSSRAFQSTLHFRDCFLISSSSASFRKVAYCSFASVTVRTSFRGGNWCHSPSYLIARPFESYSQVLSNSVSNSFHRSPSSRSIMASNGAKMNGTASSIYPAAGEFMYFPSRRSTVHSTKGIVASTQPLASQAGLRILREGGNCAVSIQDSPQLCTRRHL